MPNTLHTILGASGSSGQAVLKALQDRQLPVNNVERSKQVAGVETIKADLLDADAATAAISQSAYVYLCVGLPYQSAVWNREWPVLMRNVIDACEKANATLVILDNVYMYGPAPLSVPFDEQHLQHPTTKKGLVRKKTTDMLLTAIAKKRVRAVIGRAADFYGEGSVNSLLYISFLQNLLKGKKPQVMVKKGVPHTYGYTGDIGRALVALALDERTHGKVWHLPVGEPVTIDQVNQIFNRALGTDLSVTYIPGLMRKILSIFIPVLKEVEEMLYQFERPYEMNYNQFQRQFPDFKTTPYQEGLNRMVESFKAAQTK